MSDSNSNMTIRSHRGDYSVSFHQKIAEISQNWNPEKTHILIDQKVASIYRDVLGAILDTPSIIEITATEENKSLNAIPAQIERLLAHRIKRDHTLIAIGGGITQDITCFIASTLFRGMEWKFIPTTLLAQADSCIGSKSSVNCSSAKNIVGTFYPPRQIWIAHEFLFTLSEADVRSGVGEMLKVHAIAGPTEFEKIRDQYDHLFLSPDKMLHFLRRSLEIKKNYVEKDEYDREIRNVLNYGHSFGHAIEAATEFKIPHGIAVTIGMNLANFYSWKIGRLDQDWYEETKPVFRKNAEGFLSEDIPMDRFISAISKDKKNLGSDLVLILPNSERIPEKTRVPNDQNFSDICSEFLKEIRFL